MRVIVTGEISEKSDTSIVAEWLVGENVMMSPHSKLIEFYRSRKRSSASSLDEVSEGAAWPRRPIALRYAGRSGGGPRAAI